MPRNAAGNYTLPLPPVVTGTSIMASVENTTDSDIAAELTNSLDRNGRGGMLAPFKIFDGTAGAPGLAFTQDPDNGLYRIGNDNWAVVVAGVNVLEFGANAVTVPASAVLTVGGLAVTTLHVTGNATLDGNATISGTLYGNGVNAKTVSAHNTGQSNVGPGCLSVGADEAGGWATMVFASDATYYCVAKHSTEQALYFSGNIKANGYQIYASELFTSFTGNSGVVRFGTDPNNQYFHFSGAAWNLFSPAGISAPLRVCHGMSVNCGEPLVGPIGGIFDVRTAADRHIIFTTDSGATIAGLNDASSAWTLIYLGGGATQVNPTYDSATAFGNPSNRWYSVYAVNGVVTGSDERLKKDVQDSTLGLEFIEALRPVSYKWITEKNVVERVPDGVEPTPEYTTIDGEFVPKGVQPKYKDSVTPIPGVLPHWGLIAQEVKATLAARGLDATGFVVQEKAEDMMGLHYHEFIAPLIKAVQELSAKVTALEGAPA